MYYLLYMWVFNSGINPVYSTGHFLCPQKTENQRLSDISRGHRNRPVALNESIEVDGFYEQMILEDESKAA